MSETNLIPIPDANQGALSPEAVKTAQGRAILVQIFERGKAPDLVAAIRAQALSVVADPETAKGRATLRSEGAKVGEYRAQVERSGKALKEWVEQDVRVRVKAIDASRKEIAEGLAKVREEVIAPAVAVEQRIEADKQRQDDAINHMRRMAGHPMDGSVQVALRIAAVEEIEIADDFGARRDEALSVRDSVLAQLSELHASAVKAEAQAARLAELERIAQEQAAEIEARNARDAAEQAERERVAREAREAAERQSELDRAAEEAARLAREEAERKAREVQERAEQARVQAEREAQAALARAEQAHQTALRAQQEAEQRARDAEQRRAQEAEQAQRRQDEAVAKEQERVRRETAERERAAAALAADREHRAAIHREIVEGLMISVPTDSDQARAITEAIARGKIAHVRIDYSDTGA